MRTRLAIKISVNIFVGLLLGVGPTLVLAEPSSCQKRLMTVLGKLAPPESTVRFGDHIQNPTTIMRLELQPLFKPLGQVELPNSQKIPLAVGNYFDMKEIIDATNRKGFWILFTSSGPDQRLATGHHSLLINGTVFNRLSDDLGPEAMRSVETMEAAVFVSKQQYVVGQFFETSDEAANILERFYHDRVWNYHAGNPKWRTHYDRLPTPKQINEEACENCAIFSWNFMDEKWLALSPDLIKVQQEIGPITVARIPSLQTANNFANQAHRMTFIWGPEKTKLVDELKDSTFSNSSEGHQALLHGFSEDE